MVNVIAAPVKLAELNRRVVLCSQQDVVIDSKTMELRRTEVVWAWAKIRSYPNMTPYLGQSGYTIMPPSAKLLQTHSITVRAGLDVIITDTAYVYEAFRKSAPRWYKVLGWSELPGGWFVLTSRLIEYSDLAIPPQTALAPQPSRVEL